MPPKSRAKRRKRYLYRAPWTVGPLVKILESKGFRVIISSYTINKTFSSTWLRINPMSYGTAVAVYRLIASQIAKIAKPSITIIKGIRE